MDFDITRPGLYYLLNTPAVQTRIRELGIASRVCFEKGEPDEEYKKTFETLSQIRENGGIEYLYVVKPEPSEVYYVLDTDPSEGAIPLGYHESYYAGDFAENAEKMVRGEKIEPIISNEEFGWLMSVYYPMFTSDGRAAGYVGVDILMNEVMNMTKDHVLKMLIQSDSYLSGETVSQELGITRAAVNAAVKSLRADGYIIDSVTNRGYKLMNRPDILCEGVPGIKTHRRFFGKHCVSSPRVTQ